MKPILFSTPMVQAILDGRKTMTRRIINPQPLFYTGRRYVFADEVCPKKWEDCDNIIKTYTYQAGDILWVRETWSPVYVTPKRFLYKADVELGIGEGAGLPVCWHPSIHMPREAARIFLRVTDVRIERLQDITVEDVIAEGLPAENEIRNPDPETHEGIKSWNLAYAQHLFRELWDSINGKRGYEWNANPWVWVISFERATIGGEGETE